MTDVIGRRQSAALPTSGDCRFDGGTVDCLANRP